MSQMIVPPFEQGSFDPDTTAVMGEAFERACAALQVRPIEQQKLVREVIAKRIMEASRAGERDAEKLCARVLNGLDLAR